MDLEITPNKFLQQVQINQDFKNIKRRKHKKREPVVSDQRCCGCINCWGKPTNGDLRFGIGICHQQKSNRYHKQVMASDWCKYYEGDVD